MDGGKNGQGGDVGDPDVPAAPRGDAPGGGELRRRPPASSGGARGALRSSRTQAVAATFLVAMIAPVAALIAVDNGLLGSAADAETVTRNAALGVDSTPGGFGSDDAGFRDLATLVDAVTSAAPRERVARDRPSASSEPLDQAPGGGFTGSVAVPPATGAGTGSSTAGTQAPGTTPGTTTPGTTTPGTTTPATTSPSTPPVTTPPVTTPPVTTPPVTTATETTATETTATETQTTATETTATETTQVVEVTATVGTEGGQ
jgi:hypothetical protein